MFIGNCSFKSISIYAKPSGIFPFIISTPAIIKYYESYLLEKSVSSFELNKDSKYFIFFMLQINQCQNGEIYKVDINRFLLI